MTMRLELTPQAEAWLNAEARQRGLLPEAILQGVIEERAANATMTHQRVLDNLEKDPTIGLLQSWIAEDTTDDREEMREAEDELTEFKRTMNAPRREAGERLLFPEVE